jgi:hypothetical protein
MLKNLHPTTKKELLNLYNYIWTKRVFPITWGAAFVIPILKPGKRGNDPKNYRPIALMNNPSKLLEKWQRKDSCGDWNTTTCCVKVRVNSEGVDLRRTTYSYSKRRFRRAFQNLDIPWRRFLLSRRHTIESAGE